MEVGDLEQMRLPTVVGYSNYPDNLSFFPDRVNMLGGVPHQGGLQGQLVRATRFCGVSFLHAKAAEWGNLPNRGNQITPVWRIISTISPPKPSKR